ncbi:MAG: cytochrome c3 family protein [Nitrospirota bacterium]
MKNHVIRPLFVVVGLVALILIIRVFVVPKDFGVHERGYMFGWYRKSNEGDWKTFKIKYQTSEYCKDCHSEQYKKIINSKHAKVQCENCHGPAADHPEKPEKLSIGRSRELCLRCHAYLPYRPSVYAQLPGVPITLKMQDPNVHNPGIECVTCHSTHEASLK